MINGAKLSWTMEHIEDQSPVELVRSMSDYEDDPRSDDEIVVEIKQRIAEGDRWAWAKFIVQCCVPGYPGLHGLSFLSPLSFRDEKSFLEKRPYWVLSLREIALTSLVAQIAGFEESLAKCRLEFPRVTDSTRPGETVYHSAMPIDDGHRLEFMEIKDGEVAVRCSPEIWGFGTANISHKFIILETDI